MLSAHLILRPSPPPSHVVTSVRYRDLPQWPVDLDFTLRWFAAGGQCAKLCASNAAGKRAMYEWRQHSRNGTRWQGRCCLDALRACKAHYLAKGVCAPPVAVEIWSCGATLDSWVQSLRMAGINVAATVRWRPGSARPAADAARAAAAGDAPHRRLFAFGTAKARRKVRAALGSEWRDGEDFFVA